VRLPHAEDGARRTAQWAQRILTEWTGWGEWDASGGSDASGCYLDIFAVVAKLLSLGISITMNTSHQISPKRLVKFIVWCIAVSLLAAVIWLTLGYFYTANRWSGVTGFGVQMIGKWSGGLGCMAALFGSVIAFWSAIRVRDRRLLWLALLSVLPLAFWSWLLYNIVHG
jgi:hypothetical protein